MPEGGEVEATPEKPQYSVFRHSPCQHVEASEYATMLYGVQVNEGWRSWILCTNMYKDKADQLVETLQTSGKMWRDG